MTSGLPIIDLASFSGDDAPTGVAERIGAACREAGFSTVVNHGVPTADRGGLRAVAPLLRPAARRQGDDAIETLGGNRGYSGLMHEALDPARGPDLKEAFNVGFDLKPDDPELLAGKPFRSLNPGRSNGIPRDAPRLLRRLRRARSALAPRLRPRPRRRAGLFRRQVRPPDGDPAALAPGWIRRR